jgi:AcrR family transcriptional regulator
VGAGTSITDVAYDLHVTRQTVYRYFSGIEDLLQATALQAVGEFMDRLVAGAARPDDPGAAVVELVASTLERLPEEPYIGILISAERIGTYAKGITSSTALAFGRVMFERLPVDWNALGLIGPLFDEFVEHVLRMVQSLVLDPGDPPRSGEALRAYLARWLWAPALAATRTAPMV